MSCPLKQGPDFGLIAYSGLVFYSSFWFCARGALFALSLLAFSWLLERVVIQRKKFIATAFRRQLISEYLIVLGL
jgi:hypothetical protein